MPLHYWNYETFKRIVRLWGKMVKIGENTTKANNFKKFELFILIKQPNQIEELIS